MLRASHLHLWSRAQTPWKPDFFPQCLALFILLFACRQLSVITYGYNTSSQRVQLATMMSKKQLDGPCFIAYLRVRFLRLSNELSIPGQFALVRVIAKTSCCGQRKRLSPNLSLGTWGTPQGCAYYPKDVTQMRCPDIMGYGCEAGESHILLPLLGPMNN